jgi:L-seryl-tRNA(Ser) seleniumtransferase
MTQARASLRDLPSVDRLLSHARAAAWLASVDREYVARLCRETLADLRRQIAEGASLPLAELDEHNILTRVERRMKENRQSGLVRIVNATGTILHTNFGRARLPQPAIDAMVLAARHPVNLEYDLDRGARGSREALVESLLVQQTGAEAATVVNNNAAAVLVAINTLASGKEVVVSRGELVEIGGAFRIPDIVAKTGAVLREVGTTNRTHPGDYERAIGPNTGLLLKVHTSNYRIVGFSSDVGLGDLVAIGRSRGVPVMEDLGSGALVDLSQYGLPKEPLVSERVALLGGPQAGLVVGARALVRQIASNPLHRAVRCSKLALAALEATLRLYQQSADITRDIPTLRTFTRSLEEIAEVGLRVLPSLQHALGASYRVSLEDSTSQVGSGALPTEELPTKVIAIESDSVSADRLAERFRGAHPPIVGRIKDGRFLLDLRTVDDPADLVPRWEPE